jgi:TatD DNase family protein
MMSHPYFNVHSHHHDNKNITIFQASSILEDCWFSFGIHPWEANSNIDFSMFHEILKHQNCLATGEIGLDRLKGKDLSKQLEIFTKQIELSEELQLPVIIHCVKAWNELKILKRKLNPIQPWIFHGFSKVNILDEVLSEGFYVSFGEAILKNRKLLDSASKTPNEKVFLETDDSEVPIEMVYLEFAIAKQITLQELKEIQFSNLKRVFKKWKSG